MNTFLPRILRGNFSGLNLNFLILQVLSISPVELERSSHGSCENWSSCPEYLRLRRVQTPSKLAPFTGDPTGLTEHTLNGCLKFLSDL